MAWALLVAATLASCELAMRLPLTPVLRDMTRSAGRARRVISSSAISDHWKEVALPRLAFRMFSASMRLGGIILALLAPFAVAAAIGTALGEDVAALLLGLWGALAVIAVAWIYLGLLRKRLHV